MTIKSASGMPELIVVCLGSSENMGIPSVPALDHLTAMPTIAIPGLHEQPPARPLSELMQMPEVQQAILKSFRHFPLYTPA